MESSDTFKESDEAVRAYQKVLGSQNKEETRQAYDDWADNYDEHCSHDAYFKVPHEIARLCCKHVELSKDTVILDVGGGTGEVAVYLRKKANFNGVIDILDSSMNMLLKASKRNCNYRCIVQHLVTAEIPLPKQSYDVVLSAGAFATNHLPISAFQPKDAMHTLEPSTNRSFDNSASHEFVVKYEHDKARIQECLRLVKPNGFFLMTDEIEPKEPYRTELSEVINMQKKDGKIKLLETMKIFCPCGEVYGAYVFQSCI